MINNAMGKDPWRTTLNNLKELLYFALSEEACNMYFLKDPSLRKKVEPKWLHHGAVLETDATLEGGAVFFLNNHVWEKNGASDQSGTICQNGSTVEPFSRIFPKKVENGTTFPKVELFF